MIYILISIIYIRISLFPVADRFNIIDKTQ